MNKQKNRLKEFCRSLGATVAALLIVAAIIGSVLYSTSNHDAKTGVAVGSVKRPGSSSEQVPGGGTRGLDGHVVGAIKPKSRELRSSKAAGTAESWRYVEDLGQQGEDATESGGNPTIEREENPDLTSATSRGGLEQRPEGRLSNRASAQNVRGSISLVDGKVAEVGPAERKKRDASWKRKLTEIDKGFHVSRASDSARLKARDKAEAALDAIDDPMAVPAIWAVLSGNPGHHQVVARTLARIKSSAGTGMLAALSVYSRDEKARHLAADALRTREPDEFVKPLISVFNRRMTFRPQWIDVPGGGRAQVLFIEGERVNYQFLYPPPEESPGPSRANVYSLDNPYMPRQQAEAFNRAQSAMARAATDAQLKADIEEVERLNQLVDVMNDRAVRVLREATGKNLMADREQWKRWLAERRGYAYVPPTETQKPTIAQVVAPLYRPTFVQVYAPT